jgi:hypothetical protein
MARSYRHQAFIEAPLDDVWSVVSDPRTHEDWWPEVEGIVAGEGLGEGDEYLYTSKILPFRDAVESVWVVERMEQLKEVHFRCTLSGTYARFTLTPAQGHTFVEAESGMEPTALRWRVLGALGRAYFRNWVIQVLDALPARCRREVRSPDLQGM